MHAGYRPAVSSLKRSCIVRTIDPHQQGPAFECSANLQAWLQAPVAIGTITAIQGTSLLPGYHYSSLRRCHGRQQDN